MARRRLSRRDALKLPLALGALAALTGRGAFAAPLDLPIGTQLYQLGDQLDADFDGTLREVARIGYRFVELAGLYGRKPADLKRSLDTSGLQCVSAGVLPDALAPEDAGERANPARLFDDFRSLGLTTIVCVLPPLPQRLHAEKPASIEETAPRFTADDWREAGAFLNAAGAAAAKAGLQLAYHNHGWEFRPLGDGRTGFDILAATTDPALVQFQLDCGWVASQGLDPAVTMRTYGARISSMHIKDIARPPQGGERLRTVAVGAGMIDWPAVFAAASGGALRHYFVELEPPFEAPMVWQILRESHAYLQSLKV